MGKYQDWLEATSEPGELDWYEYPLLALEGIANLFGRSFFSPEEQRSEAVQRTQEWHPVSGLFKGMGQTFGTLGATITHPVRMQQMGVPVSEWFAPEHLGGKGWEEYQKWEAPSIPMGIPSWSQWGEWLGVSPSEPGYQMAEMGMKEVAEMAPFLFIGGGALRTPTGLLKTTGRTGRMIKPTELGVKAPRVTRPTIATEEVAPEVTGRATFRELGVSTKPATNAQKIKIHTIAREKNLISEAGKMKPQYRRLAKAMTGKTSAAKMTDEEADIFIKALDSVVMRGVGQAPKIPVSTGVITEEFAKKIPMLQEVGALERVRPSRQVFEKMGLRQEVWEPAFEAEVKLFEEQMAFRRELKSIEKLVSKSRRPAIFKALENPAEVAALSPQETAAYQWFKRYFDDWANRLKLPAEKRRASYVTHIFEEAIKQDLAAKHPLNPEIIRAMDFAGPKTVFNPFLQKRLGQTTGLIEDPFLAASAYESRALKVFHYEPLLQRIRVYEKYLPPNSARYLRDFTSRLTSRPLAIDKEINQTLKEFAQAIKGLPYGEKLAAQLTRGNAGGLAAYNYTSMLYFLWLGFKITSAIRNLSQHFLALADVGPINFAKGVALRFTKEGKTALAKSMVLRSRKQAYMPGIDTSFASRWADKIRETSLKMFRWADRQNVSDSFLAGYSEAKSLGLPERWCILRGDEVAANTQYLYTRLAGAQWSQNTLGRVLSPLTTWPENWLELVTRWTGSKGSYIYREYAAATGKNVAGMAWDTKRKALLLYLALVGGAYATQYKTKFRASEYTGWTSIRYLQDIAAGELPGLEFPRAFAEIIGGALTGDNQTMKAGWSRIRPDRMMGIIRQFERIADGKTDWLSLFVYLNPEKSKEEGLPGLPSPSESLPSLPELELPSLTK